MKKKKLLSIFISMVCAVSILGFGDIPLTSDTGGVISAEETIPEGYTPIYNIEDLYGINNNLSGNYILMNDIDMTEDTAPGGDWDINGTGWEPIDDFNGTFDGNGNAIIGMNIHGDVQYQEVGLFKGLAQCGVITNLKMLDVNINISSTKHISGSQGMDAGTVGSICGFIQQRGEISNCFATGEIFVSYVEIAGGIVGAAKYGWGSYNAVISNCYNAVNIQSDGTTYLGGIIGEGNCAYYNIPSVLTY